MGRKSKALIRVTRNADINLEESDDLEMVDYRAAMKDLIKKRSRMAAIRLEYRYEVAKAIIPLICVREKLRTNPVCR